MVCTAADLRGLAKDSLTLLKEFLYDERFPALFDLEVYGSIIGMFELNNLSKLLSPAVAVFLPLLPVHAKKCICSVLTCNVPYALPPQALGKWHARLMQPLRQSGRHAGIICCIFADPMHCERLLLCRFVCGVTCRGLCLSVHSRHRQL